MTSQEIASKLNENGFDYYGDTAKAWDGNGFSRIYFGREFVTIESDGRVHNERKGSARANTIGSSAVEAVEAVINA